jgi:hypothetical protein
MDRAIKPAFIWPTILIVTLLAFLVGCATVSPEETSGLDGFRAGLESAGFTIAEITVLYDPVPASQVTVVAADAYSAIQLESRLAHEAALARARGDYPYDSIMIKVVDPKGTLLALDQEIVTALAATTASTSVEDSQAVQVVRDFLAVNAERRLHGLTITSVAVTTKDGERTLQVGIDCSDEGRVAGGLDWLIIGGTSEDGWIGDLNKEGVGLNWVEVRVTYDSGLPDSFSVIDVARRSVSTYSGGRTPDFGPRPSTTESPGS